MRTKSRRLMPNLRRISSIFSFWRAMIFRCAGVGSGGMNSPFDAGMTSIGGCFGRIRVVVLVLLSHSASPCGYKLLAVRAPKSGRSGKTPAK